MIGFSPTSRTDKPVTTSKIIIEAYEFLQPVGGTQIKRKYEVTDLSNDGKKFRGIKEKQSLYPPYAVGREMVVIDPNKHDLLEINIVRSNGVILTVSVEINDDDPNAGWDMLREHLEKMVSERSQSTTSRYDVEDQKIYLDLEWKAAGSTRKFVRVLLKYVTFMNDGRLSVMFVNNDPKAGEEGHDAVYPEVTLNNYYLTEITQGITSHVFTKKEDSQNKAIAKLKDIVEDKKPVSKSRSGAAYWDEDELYYGEMYGYLGYASYTGRKKSLMFIEGYPNEAQKDA
jgi:hypothetical protein